MPPLSTAQGEGQVVEAQIPLSESREREQGREPNAQQPSLPPDGRCADSGAGGGMGAWFAGLLNGITKASVNGRREGQIGNSGARCVYCSSGGNWQVGALVRVIYATGKQW